MEYVSKSQGVSRRTGRKPAAGNLPKTVSVMGQPCLLQNIKDNVDFCSWEGIKSQMWEKLRQSSRSQAQARPGYIIFKKLRRY